MMLLDENSQLTIFRLMNRKVIARLGSPIRQGKESLVIEAKAPDGVDLAVKVHTSRVFGRREKMQYLFGDWRFRHAKHHITLRTEEIWAEKEYRNLARLDEAGILGPRPVAFEKNVVVMTLVGQEGQSAPQLNELEDADYEKIARSTLTTVRQLVTHAKMVHGDLSAYNILVWDSQPYLIDLSQAVLVSHPDAPRLVQQDLEKLAGFFATRGVDSDAFYELLKELQEEG